MTNQSLSFLATGIEAGRVADAERQFNERFSAPEIELPFEVLKAYQVYEVSLPEPSFFSLEFKEKPVENAIHLANDRWQVWTQPGASREQVSAALVGMCIAF